MIDHKPSDELGHPCSFNNAGDFEETGVTAIKEDVVGDASISFDVGEHGDRRGFEYGTVRCVAGQCFFVLFNQYFEILLFADTSSAGIKSESLNIVDFFSYEIFVDNL